MLRLRSGTAHRANVPAPHTPVQQVHYSAWLSGAVSGLNHQVKPYRHVRASAKKWQDDDAEEEEDAAPSSKRGKRAGKRSKGKGRASDEEVEIFEDIGGGIDIAPVNQRQPEKAEQAVQQLTVAASAGKAGASGAPRAPRPRSSDGSKRIFLGPRQGLSYSALEQREAMGNLIRNAPDWRALAALIDSKGSAMDAEQTLLVLFKLSCCPVQERPGGGTRKLSREELQKLQQAFGRPQDVEAGLEHDRMLSTLLGWVLVLMPTFRPRQVVKCLTSLAYMKLFNVEVATGLKDVVVKQMINFTVADYGAITGSFAKLGFFPEPEFTVLLMKKTARKLAGGTAEDLGKMVQGLSELGCVPTAEWAEAFWAASADKASDFAKSATASKSMLVAVSCFAQSGVQPPQQWVDTVLGALVAPDSQNRGPRVPVINAMLYALTSLACKPSQEWFAAVLDAWRAQLMYCIPSDLGTISLYLGRYLGVTVPQPLGTQLLSKALRDSKQMQADDLAAVAYLLGASRLKFNAKELDDLGYVLGLRLGGCSIAGLEMLAAALPCFTDHPRLRTLLEQVTSRYSSAMQAQGDVVPQEQLAMAAV